MLITKPIALLINDSVQLGSKNLVKPQKNKISLKISKAQSKPEKGAIPWKRVFVY